MYQTHELPIRFLYEPDVDDRPDYTYGHFHVTVLIGHIRIWRRWTIHKDGLNRYYEHDRREGVTATLDEAKQLVEKKLIARFKSTVWSDADRSCEM